LTLIPHLEKPFKLNDDIDKKSFLFILYIADLSALMFSINWLINLPEQHKTILFAIIGGLYGAVIPRYLTATLEVIEKQFGIKK
ncbi:hypothetical protein, partial [Rodentibacter caecimuris]|uniref:hypothetical protein n=1 Tax=Rodentibacter caecimuris TaxID=1796644 RepID=UPI0012FF9491